MGPVALYEADGIQKARMQVLGHCREGGAAGGAEEDGTDAEPEEDQDDQEGTPGTDEEDEDEDEQMTRRRRRTRAAGKLRPAEDRFLRFADMDRFVEEGERAAMADDDDDADVDDEDEEEGEDDDRAPGVFCC